MTEMQNPVVSVCCISYNHEPYMRQALESVLAQKTNFPFEVIIHDDASTDNSAQIIREYQKKYPNIIVPIFQKENQLSKGIRFSTAFVYPKVRGEFAAFLECDDFWCDEYKLQKQVDVMRTYPECIMCAHRVGLHYENGVHKNQYVPTKELPEGMLSTDEAIQHVAVGDMFHTSCRLVRAKYLKKYDSVSYVKNAKIVGDLPKILFLAQQGMFYYSPDEMSGYRIGSHGSYTERLGNDYDYAIKTRQEIRETWRMFGQEHPAYQELAQRKAEEYLRNEIELRTKKDSWEQLHILNAPPYREVYKTFSPMFRATAWGTATFPWVRRLYHKMKRALLK